ncbi:MAG: hypothetical protein ABI035_07130 [Gemmatimonadaceae bacterium]
MCDYENDDTWSSDDVSRRDENGDGFSGRMAAMSHELGRRDSPAFEKLRDYMHTPCNISASTVAEVVRMLQARCFADSQSYRQTRAKALWAELEWMDEDTLIDTFVELWDPLFHRWWQFSALVQHKNAGPALWEQALSRRIDIKTVMHIIAAASDRGAQSFLAQLAMSLVDLDIVSSAR